MDPVPDTIEERRPPIGTFLRQAFLSGAAITLPILLTILVFLFAINFLGNFLDPAVVVMHRSLGLGDQLPDLAAEFVALIVLSILILLVGIVAESDVGRGRVEGRLEAAMASIPGFGSIYNSINEISDLLIQSDTDSFREVKLVEYPTEGSYTVGFLTAESPDVVESATDHEGMVTLFMPMAPNPFMGGFVIHVSADRVYDVDMSVDEGIQAIVSSGVAVNDPGTTDEIGDHSPGGVATG